MNTKVLSQLFNQTPIEELPIYKFGYDEESKIGLIKTSAIFFASEAIDFSAFKSQTLYEDTDMTVLMYQNPMDGKHPCMYLFVSRCKLKGSLCPPDKSYLCMLNDNRSSAKKSKQVFKDKFISIVRNTTEAKAQNYWISLIHRDHIRTMKAEAREKAV